MKKETILKLQKTLLIFAAIGLIPIALSYGFLPAKSLGFLFGIEVANINLENILRAVMGLYLALVVFWLMGTFKSNLREPAIYSLIVFMYGLAAGRIISFLVDGIPHPLIIIYLLLELLLGTLGMMLARKA